jgi:hypothetical protein
MTRVSYGQWRPAPFTRHPFFCQGQGPNSPVDGKRREDQERKSLFVEPCFAILRRICLHGPRRGSAL